MEPDSPNIPIIVPTKVHDEAQGRGTSEGGQFTYLSDLEVSTYRNKRNLGNVTMDPNGIQRVIVGKMS